MKVQPVERTYTVAVLLKAELEMEWKLGCRTRRIEKIALALGSSTQGKASRANVGSN